MSSQEIKAIILFLVFIPYMFSLTLSTFVSFKDTGGYKWAYLILLSASLVTEVAIGYYIVTGNQL